MIDHVLFIGFGGPTRAEEIRPFLREVTRGRHIPEERIQAVAHHYERIGGASPYHEAAFDLARQLEKALRAGKLDLPVFTGMRNWHPFLAETVAQVRARGLCRGLGIILAPHRSETSCRRYKRNVAEAVQKSGATGLAYDYLDPWSANPLFIKAQADRVRTALATIPEDKRADVPLVFTAHSIPVSMNEACSECRYDQEFKRSAELLAAELGRTKWSAAYQSRSGNPSDPWLEPDVVEMIDRLHRQGEKNVLLVPVGFLFDHAEILYDLDIEVREKAEALGMGYYRAATVGSHPNMMELFLAGIRERGEVRRVSF